jgi:hypothetical protein
VCGGKAGGFITHNFGNEKVKLATKTRSLIFSSFFCCPRFASRFSSAEEINGKIGHKMIHAINTSKKLLVA